MKLQFKVVKLRKYNKFSTIILIGGKLSDRNRDMAQKETSCI